MRKRQLLLVRAAVGHPHTYGVRVDAKDNKHGTRYLTRPPEEAAGKLYDCGPQRPASSGPAANNSEMVLIAYIYII